MARAPRKSGHGHAKNLQVETVAAANESAAEGDDIAAKGKVDNGIQPASETTSISETIGKRAELGIAEAELLRDRALSKAVQKLEDHKVRLAAASRKADLDKAAQERSLKEIEGGRSKLKELLTQANSDERKALSSFAKAEDSLASAKVQLEKARTVLNEARSAH